MNEWTSSARALLESHLQRHRARFAADGAEVDEVVADMRRHVESEAVAQGLTVVTESDVRRILAQMDPELVETRPARSYDPQSSSAAVKTSEHRSSFWVKLRESLAWFFGVILPIGTTLFEWTSRAAASDLVDPIPTPLHGLLILLVPLTQGLGLWMLRRSSGPLPHWFIWLLAASLGVSGSYAVLFAPTYPFACLGLLYFGFGLIPLTPLIAWICGLRLRSDGRRRAREAQVPWPRWSWLATLATLLLLIGFALPDFWTEQTLHQSVHGEEAGRTRALQQLRRWGKEEVLLRACYGSRWRMWDNLVFQDRLPVTTEQAQEIYFRVTGQAFNAVRPPLSGLRGSGRETFRDFTWDQAQGGEKVAGHVSGLSLSSSRLDAMGHVGDGWGYTEWTLEFRNDNPHRQREARAEIQLPPGASVSRLTLWVYGEEREAAFAGRAQVREAYQGVVKAQRDPVLVTTSGPDRILMQCFPVPSGGGTLKVRLGITAPLVPMADREVAFVWPRLAECNFAIPSSVRHHAWLELLQGIPQIPEGWSRDAGRPHVIHASAHEYQADSILQTIRLPRDGMASSAWAADDRSSPPGWVRQRIQPHLQKQAGRLAVVVDGGSQGEAGWQALRRVLAESQGRGDLCVWTVEDRVTEAVVIQEGPFRAAVDMMDKKRPDFLGGHDPAGALETAWNWASQKPGGQVLWIHGALPVLLGDFEGLSQRLERGGDSGTGLVDFPVERGPNSAGAKLVGLPLYRAAPRMGSVDEDLRRIIEEWTGMRPRWSWVKERRENLPEAGVTGSKHLVRLWARDRVEELRKQRKISEAVDWAARWQLVTAVSGAVVLETKAQFSAAGLNPVDPLTTPTIVPEPQSWALLLLGSLLLYAWRRKG